MDDILFLRRFVFQKQVANPQLVRIVLLFQTDAWTDTRVNVVAEFVLAGSRQPSQPLGIVQQDFSIRMNSTVASPPLFELTQFCLSRSSPPSTA